MLSEEEYEDDFSQEESSDTEESSQDSEESSQSESESFDSEDSNSENLDDDGCSYHDDRQKLNSSSASSQSSRGSRHHENRFEKLGIMSIGSPRMEMMMQDHNQQRNGSHIQMKISPGNGILCGTIDQAIELGVSCIAQVKVSYVEPGESDNVMFRSKQVIFETEPSLVESTQPSWNVSFEYDIFPPDGNDWASLTGDVLFAIYDCTNARRKVFLGQVLIPLLDLVDKDMNGMVHGGTQQSHSKVYSLLDRGCNTSGKGALSLRLRLELPPEEPATPTDADDARNDDTGFVAQESPKKRQQSQKKQKKAGKSSKRPLAQVQTERLRRSRLNKLKSITKENMAIHKRLTKLKPMTNHDADPSSNSTPRRNVYLKETQTWRKSTVDYQHGTYSGTNELNKLAKEKEELQVERHNLEAEIEDLQKAMLRLESSSKRTRTIMSQIKEAETQSRNRRMIRKWNSTANRETKTQDTTDSDFNYPRAKLETLRKQVLRQMEIYSERAKSVNEIHEQQRAVTDNINESLAELDALGEKLELVQQRQLRKRQQFLQNDSENQRNSSNDSVLEIQQSEREIRVQIAVEKASMEELQNQHKFEKKKVQMQIDELTKKLEKKESKIANQKKLLTSLHEQYQKRLEGFEQKAQFLRKQEQFYRHYATMLK